MLAAELGVAVSTWLPGLHSSPNLHRSPWIHELGNEAVDPDHRIEAALQELAPWDDRVVVDLGSGTGFHLARYQARARHVIAVEPHEGSRLLAMARISKLGLERISVMN